MSWSIEFTGSREEVSEAFDKQKAQSASYGMIEQEQNDIEIAKYLGCSFAEKYGRVHVSASGYWNIVSGKDGVDLEASKFQRTSITITPATDEVPS